MFLAIFTNDERRGHVAATFATKRLEPAGFRKQQCRRPTRQAALGQFQLFELSQRDQQLLLRQSTRVKQNPTTRGCRGRSGPWVIFGSPAQRRKTSQLLRELRPFTTFSTLGYTNHNRPSDPCRSSPAFADPDEPSNWVVGERVSRTKSIAGQAQAKRIYRTKGSSTDTTRDSTTAEASPSSPPTTAPKTSSSDTDTASDPSNATPGNTLSSSQSTITDLTTVSLPSDDPRASTFSPYTCQWGCPGRPCVSDQDCGDRTLGTTTITIGCVRPNNTCAWP